MMLERLLFAIVIIAAGLLIWQLYNRRALRHLAAEPIREPVLLQAERGKPVILYFTTPTCSVCRTQQQPTLKRVVESFGATVQIVQIDAVQDPDAADRWGVFSAPTTFVLDANFQPQFVNRGVATHETLSEQVRGVLQTRSA